jgi:hypothetical protein
VERRDDRNENEKDETMTATKAEIIRVEEVQDHEGRDGRIRTRKVVLWAVVRDGELLCSEFERLKDAQAYLTKVNA